MARPAIDEDKKIGKDGLYNQQREYLQKEADARGLSYAYILRGAVSWYISAMEQARAGSVASEEDDKEHDNLVSSNSKKGNKKSNKTNNRKG